MLLLVKCYDKKMVKSPYNCVIFPLTQPQVANQQQQKNIKLPFTFLYATVTKPVDPFFMVLFLV